MKLRKLELKDAGGMLEWMHDPEIWKCFRGDMQNKTLADVTEFIQSAKVIPVNGGSVHFAIADDVDEYMGTVSLKGIDMTAGNAEYAIALRKCAQSKGIGTLATKGILKIAFDEFAFEKVYLNVLADNKTAIRMYEKAGFVYEGQFRKHLFLQGQYKTLNWYSILKEEYQNTHKADGKGEENIYYENNAQ